MVTASTNDPAIICAERIAALHFLHHVPATPSSNPVTGIHRRSAGYTLPFEKERGLAGTLAFLAYPKDAVDHIPAVCIEEVGDAKYLNVILAINKAEQTSGQQFLEELKKRFEVIFSLLAQADAGLFNVEIEVFKAIVSMCLRRILHRLRLRGSKIHYQSIEKALQRAYEHLRHANRGNFKKNGLLPVLDEFLRNASEVLKLVRSWAGHQTDLRLEELVEGIYRLRKVGDLSALFENGHIPDQIMDPGLRRSLLNMISKVARYREAARFLYRMGKKFPLARRMRVVIAQWSKEAFERVQDDTHTPRLKSTISLTEGLKDREKDLPYICRLLDDGKGPGRGKITSKKAESKFAEQTRETLRNAKVHAEIQLLYYCEQNIPHNRLPRVVCSSKDACWLCNEFILLYEKIHMPKSHGRLYPGWRLPALRKPEFEDLANRYNQRLQGSLRDSLKRLVEIKKRTNYPDPNESTLLTLYLSDSTLSTVSLPLPESKEKGAVEVVQEVIIPENRELTYEPTSADDEESKRTVAEVEVIEEVAPEGSPITPEPTPEPGPVHDSDLADNEKNKETIAESKGVGATLEASSPLPEQESIHNTAPTNNEKSKEVITRVEETEVLPETSSTNDEEISDMPDWSTNTSTTESSSGTSDSASILEPGEVRHGRIKMGKTTPTYKAGSLLDVRLEYASGPILLAPDGHRKKLAYAVEYLKPEDVESSSSRTGVVPIASADLPEYWIDGNTDGDGCMYIANGDTVIRLIMRSVAGGSKSALADDAAG
ncbi:hypothetical protein F5Y13DRAFT_83058 [Hypoxylon sp. FL1857]|nr:hypothetical protein F5Y13DRAFT_83058 [Hypoxylon sp. FL1857]